MDEEVKPQQLIPKKHRRNEIFIVDDLSVRNEMPQAVRVHRAEIMRAMVEQHQVRSTQTYRASLIRPLEDDQARLRRLYSNGTTEALAETNRQSKPCDGCAHYVGRKVNGGFLRGELCCAMWPSGPDADECPDWEHKASHESKRRMLRQRHLQERAAMEARHRNEADLLEANLDNADEYGAKKVEGGTIT